MTFITALSADYSFSCDYAFLWLNKSRHASSSVKICILVTAVLIKHYQEYIIGRDIIYSWHYVAKSVHIAAGKQEAVKEAQVCNESVKA